MLLPALNQAKDNSKEEVCISNLKQLAAALQRYCQDYDDWLPLSQTSEKKWTDFLDPYTGTNRDLRFKYDTSTPYHCPAALELHSGFKKTAGNTYGVNGYTLGRQDFIAEAGEWTEMDVVPQYKLKGLLHPDKCMAFGDGHWNAETKSWEIMIDINSWAIPEFLHDGGANFVFFDGHVEWKKSSDVPSDKSDVFWWPHGNRK